MLHRARPVAAALLRSCEASRRAFAAAAAGRAVHDDDGDGAEGFVPWLEAHGHWPMLTLERSVGPSAGSDGELARCGAFGYEVFPDLPIASTWSGLRKAVLQAARHPFGASTGTRGQDYDNEHETALAGVKVSTVAVNLRSLAEVERRIVAYVAGGGSGQPAGALLFVSGTHPLRSLPGARLLLRNSLDALRAASALRAAGHIPPATQLWAVANPNTELDAALLEAKVDAGATVFLSQPALDADAFDRWMADACRRGVPAAARVLAGAPMLSSAGNAAFWAALAGCGHKPAVQQLVADFRAADGGSGGGGRGGSAAAAAAAYARGWNERSVATALRTPGIAGLHVMPLTAAARRMAMEFAREGRFGDRAAAAAAAASAAPSAAPAARGGEVGSIP